MARFCEFWGKVGKLRKDFVNQPDGTAEGMGVNVLCEKAADITWKCLLVSSLACAELPPPHDDETKMA